MAALKINKKKMLNIQIRFAEIHILEELPTAVEKMAVFFFVVVFF